MGQGAGAAGAAQRGAHRACCLPKLPCTISATEACTCRHVGRTRRSRNLYSSVGRVATKVMCNVLRPCLRPTLVRPHSPRKVGGPSHGDP